MKPHAREIKTYLPGRSAPVFPIRIYPEGSWAYSQLFGSFPKSRAARVKAALCQSGLYLSSKGGNGGRLISHSARGSVQNCPHWSAIASAMPA